MQRRGQAALEFMMTYGWAFLVILIMIGSLAYFGVLDPTRFLPQRCQFGAELRCERFTLDAASSASMDIARFEIRNPLPEPVHANHTEYKLPDDNGWNKCSAPQSATGVTIERESSAVLNCSMPKGTLISGERERLQFKMVYSQGEDAFDERFANDLFGDIYANVR